MAIEKNILESAKLLVKPTSHLDYRDYLKSLYLQIKKLKSNYSYLLFAEDLGFSKTNVLHLIIQGKRPLSVKAGKKIATGLKLSGVDKNYFDILVQYQNARDSQKREQLFKKLLSAKNKSLGSIEDKSKLEFFSEWYHPTIYEMSYLDDFQADASWIADRLNARLRPEQIRKSLQLLESLNLIYFDKTSDRYHPTEGDVSTGDEIASVAVIRYHQKLIEMGKESLTRISEDLRDVSSITVCVSEEMAERLKEEVRTFRKKMLMLAKESKSMDTVYQMNVQLFPLTKEVE